MATTEKCEPLFLMTVYMSIFLFGAWNQNQCWFYTEPLFSGITCNKPATWPSAASPPSFHARISLSPSSSLPPPVHAVLKTSGRTSRSHRSVLAARHREEVGSSCCQWWSWARRRLRANRADCHGRDSRRQRWFLEKRTTRKGLPARGTHSHRGVSEPCLFSVSSVVLCPSFQPNRAGVSS